MPIAPRNVPLLGISGHFSQSAGGSESPLPIEMDQEFEDLPRTTRRTLCVCYPLLRRGHMDDGWTGFTLSIERAGESLPA